MSPLRQEIRVCRVEIPSRCMQSTLQLVASIIRSRRVKALFVGGYALNAYGVVRQTMDVDCLMTQQDAESVGKALEQDGYRLQARAETFARYRHDSPFFMDVDILFVGRDTLDKMMPDSKPFSTEEAEYRVPSLIHLIALKLHAIRNDPKRRERDLGDIAELIRLNAKEISRDELKETCLRFGPVELADAVVEYLK